MQYIEKLIENLNMIRPGSKISVVKDYDFQEEILYEFVLQCMYSLTFQIFFSFLKSTVAQL